MSTGIELYAKIASVGEHGNTVVLLDRESETTMRETYNVYPLSLFWERLTLEVGMLARVRISRDESRARFGRCDLVFVDS